MDVRQQLQELAQDAPVAVPPADLWRRGVRHRRRRLAGAVAATVLAVAVGGGTVGLVWERTAPALAPAPATTSAPGAIPLRVEAPSPWLPDDADKGPIGPLAVAAGAPRGTFPIGERPGILGVSARDGAYRFLHLPDLADGSVAGVNDEGVALSPDGHWLAYWQRGRTQLSSGEEVDGVVGVVAYDTVTGRRTRLDLSSKLGVDGHTLAWFDDDRLFVDAGMVIERTSDTLSSRSDGQQVWTPASGGKAVQKVPFDTFADGVRPAGAGATFVRGRNLVVLGADLTVVARHRLESGATGTDWSSFDAWLSPDGRTVAVLQRNETGTTNRLLLGRVQAGVVRLRAVARPAQPRELLGWRDDDHVVVSTAAKNQSGARYADAVDVRTARGPAPTRLSTVTVPSWSGGLSFASSLWSTETVARPGPPGVLDPRLVAAGGGAVVLALVLLVRRFRGRRELA